MRPVKMRTVYPRPGANDCQRPSCRTIREPGVHLHVVANSRGPTRGTGQGGVGQHAAGTPEAIGQGFGVVATGVATPVVLASPSGAGGPCRVPAPAHLS